MKATHSILKGMLGAVESGDLSALAKCAARYKDDADLQAVCSGMKDMPKAELVERLRALYDSRRFQSPGTALSMSDRRHMTTEKRKPENFD